MTLLGAYLRQLIGWAIASAIVFGLVASKPWWPRKVDMAEPTGQAVPAGGVRRVCGSPRWVFGELGQISAGMETLRHLAVTPDGRWALAAPIKASQAYVVDLTARLGSRELPLAEQQVMALAISPNGRRTAIASSTPGRGTQEPVLELWDLSAGGRPMVLAGSTEPIRQAAFSTDGNDLHAATQDGALCTWSAADGRLTRRLDKLPGTVWGLSGERFVCLARRTAVTTAGSATLARHSFPRPDSSLRLASGVSSQPHGTAVSADGALAVTCGSGNRLLGIDTQTGRVLWEIKVDVGGVGLVALSADAGRALLACDTSLALCDIRSRRVVRYARGSLAVQSVDVTGDFTLAALGGEGVIQLWDLRVGQPVGVLEGNRGGVFAVRFSRDGRRLLAADSQWAVRLWEPSTGQCLRCWDFGSGGSRFALSPDGRRFLQRGYGRGLRVWDVDAEDPIDSMTAGHRWYPEGEGAVFAPDGATVLIPCRDGKVRLWELDR